MRLISSFPWRGFGWSVAAAAAASTSRALEERGAVVEKIGTDAVCTCPTSPSDLPIQEEICNIGNSPNSTTKCLTLSFIYVFFFLFFHFFKNFIMSCPLSPTVSLHFA